MLPLPETRPCASGRHHWCDPLAAVRCCNGWHTELRLHAGEVAPEEWTGAVRNAIGAYTVWVRD